MMGDHRADVEPTLKHDGHLVPGLIHTATVDAGDGEHVEDDLVPVDRDVLRRDPEHGDFAPVTHVVDHFAKGVRIA